MILDRIENIGKYSELADLEPAVDYILTHDTAALADGKNVLDGEALYCNVSSYMTKTHEGARAEAHNEYIDLQYVLSGQEIMGYAPRSEMGDAAEEHPESDLYFYSGAGDTKLLVKEGMFAVFFPQDAHTPTLLAGESSPVRKAVYKIRIKK